MPDGVRIGADLAADMVEHCLKGRPNEACGLLGGSDGHVTRVFRMSNASASPVRYSLDSREQLAVHRELDDGDLELAGVFHSHTRTPAYPSPTDVRLAFEDVPYLILSLTDDPPSIRAFRIEKEDRMDARGEVREIEVVIAP